MPIPNDDEQFERYLKQFRPLEPKPLHIEKRASTTRPSFMFAGWAVAAAVIMSVVALTIHPAGKPDHSPAGHESVAGVEQLTNLRPLTIGSANALLARSTSVKAALDQVAFHSQPIQVPKGKRSALAVLSEEKTKL